MRNQITKVVERRVAELRPYQGNARTHSKRQVRQIAESIERFGFNNPILIGSDDEVIAGHGRLAAAQLLGMDVVPTLQLAHLSGEERRAYVIADNKLAANAGWDKELLAIELEALIALDFDISVTGFSVAEVDLIIGEAHEAAEGGSASRADEIPPPGSVVVSRPGDLWELGRHRLLCADARDPQAYEALLADEEVALMFTDPPYNVKIAGNVSGLGRVRHGDFAMASGEMSEAEFTSFLTSSLGLAASYCRDGAIAYVCIDWRHMGELLKAGTAAFDELKNVCVWNKTNGGWCQSNANRSPLGGLRSRGEFSHAARFCHSAKAAERRSL